jgi:hypothetical protein
MELEKNINEDADTLENREPNLFLDEKNKSLYEARQIELVEERIRRMKAENDIREGRLVDIGEAKMEYAAYTHITLRAYNEMVDSVLNPHVKELLTKFYNAWIEKAQNDIKDYMQKKRIG